MEIRGCAIEILQGDITGLDLDAIVNAANNKLLMGGGVAGAIKRNGGREIEEEAISKGPIEIGGAVSTKGGNLKARFVIHAATMGMDFRTDEIKIRSSARASLAAAERLKISSIAFPALGCGVGGFGLAASAKIMSQEVFRYLRQGGRSLKKIVFCLYDKEAYDLFTKTVFSYLDHVVNVLQNGPFVTVDAIIEIEHQQIVIIKRSNPPFGWALPGGFVDYGESLEDAVKREAREETGLDIYDVKQFHTYSDPERDPRFHTIGTAFTAKAEGEPKAASDAAEARLLKLEDIEKTGFAFDHKRILQDYLATLSAAASPRRRCRG